MKYSAVIFDLDGVICSTDHFHYQAWKRIADEENIYFDMQINKRFKGVGRMDCVRILYELTGNEAFGTHAAELAERKNGYYLEALELLDAGALCAGVPETLSALRSAGIKLAIGSVSKNTKPILQKLGIAHCFDAVSDGTNISRSKPDPEVFLKAAEFLGKPMAECLVVEDANAGIEAAVAGGFDSAGISDAAQNEKTTYRLTQIPDILKIMEIL